MMYRFRLTVASKAEGVFRFDTSETSITLPEGPNLSLVARNATTLCRATKFHFEAAGFPDEQSARAAGECLRLRLRILNAILGLGLNVPVGDSVSGQLATSAKEDLRTKQGVITVDSIWGLSVFPDDNRHFEFVLGGKLDVFPSDPSYIFTALGKLWPLDVNLDQRCEDALNILCMAAVETSDRAAFLTTYLAVETLIPRQKRSKVAMDLIEKFEEWVRKAGARKKVPLSKQEADSLLGSLANVREEFFSSAFRRFGRSVQSPRYVKGHPLDRFISQCIKTRNKIAHDAMLDSSLNLSELTAGLRELAMGLIWTYSSIPDVSFEIPASSVSISADGLQARAF